ncbi:MAG: hypothetical protein COX19_01405 [Desulfobacterales bacterium CG23_combo_of_CG06-09_8_20_14_all_51_8]|nr:MAG: hypothetical protein COX19_01405 [Desulfobacterales bacterium CG23_combo_of_CG06-09_8_20_14_all_51_8]
MPHTAGIEKRIKRHMRGKPHRFFVSTPPGMETLCAGELQGLGMPLADVGISKGGVEFTGRLPVCYLANLHLRTANRILMRLTNFTATSFRQLEKKLAEFPWELYLYKDAAFTFAVTSRHSRLIHTDAIAQRCKTSMENRLQLSGIPGKKRPDDPDISPQQIFVRAEDDQFTVSIDSTGELLHRRGLKTQGGQAPVRETLAAAILMLAGYRPGDALMDPMCGAGTFSLEAAMISADIPAGWFRDFAFMGWPVFRPAQWDHLRRAAEKTMTKISTPLIFASDIDAVICEKLARVAASFDLETMISVTCEDFFALRPADCKIPKPGVRPGLVVLNPPYGRRLGSKHTVDAMFDQIGKKLKKDFSGWKVAMMVPDKRLVKHLRFSDITTHDFFHGGLMVTLVCGQIP